VKWVETESGWKYGEWSLVPGERGGWWLHSAGEAWDWKAELAEAKAAVERKQGLAMTIALAKRACTDVKVARGPFRHQARKAGYEGAVGGWIYFQGRVVTQGWQGLADLVASGRVRFEEQQ
jgi:hypothetical protein